MGYSPLPTSPAPVFSGPDTLPPSLRLQHPNPVQRDGSGALIDTLRQRLSEGTQTSDSLLGAATDAARVLSGADGTAIALRTNGVIVCRARSGDLAPDLGSPLNVDSGISGGCLRTATILLCNDAAADDRVDPEVCRALGIRSIVVVPLRGPTGVAGILEAFSSRPCAFDGEHINTFRALAEIAEEAYRRERFGQDRVPLSPLPAVRRPPVFAPENDAVAGTGAKWFEFIARHYRIGAVIALALLLVSTVIWLSWRDAGADVAAGEAPTRAVSAPESNSGPAALRVLPLKPDAGVVSRHSNQLQASGMLRNAAEIQPAGAGLNPSSSDSVISVANRSESAGASSPPLTANDPPPAVDMATASTPPALSSIVSTQTELPAFGASVSQGVIEANLIRKVDPTYPLQARLQGLTGTVSLDAMIGEDGTVREVRVVSGPPLLANAARTAVQHWRYSPPLLDGKPIEVQKRITLVFKLP